MEFLNSIPQSATVQLALNKLNELYEIHDWYFCAEKSEKEVMMLEIVNSKIMTILESFTEDEGQQYRAIIAYIKGKALNCFETFSSESEKLLSMSVKLDPKNYQAWTALGQCLWKKGDLIQARNCFLESLNQESNKEALCELSVLMRQLRIAGQDASAAVEESIKLAKQAIELDMNDHKSWYILGNAWLTRFFATSYNQIDLNKSLNCYRRSENLGGKSNPDLYMNCGNVLRYLQCYNEALASFRKAHSLDPSMSDAATASNEITSFLHKVKDLIIHNGKIRKSRFDQLIASLRTSPFNNSGVALSSLAPGANQDVVLAVKPLLPVTNSNVPPRCVLCTDVHGKFCLLAIYDIGEDASQFTSEDVVVIVHPFLRNNSKLNEFNLVHYNIERAKIDDDSDKVETGIEVVVEVEDDLLIIQVFDIRTLRLNGGPLSKASLAAPELKIENRHF